MMISTSLWWTRKTIVELLSYQVWATNQPCVALDYIGNGHVGDDGNAGDHIGIGHVDGNGSGGGNATRDSIDNGGIGNQKW